MKFRTFLERQVDPLAGKKNKLVDQILDSIQRQILGKQSLRDSLNTSFSNFKEGDNPGANQILDGLEKGGVFKMMKPLGLPAEEVRAWLQSDPSPSSSTTIGELLKRIFNTDKVDDVINQRQLQPSEGEGEEDSAALTPDQIAQAQQQQNQPPAPVDLPQDPSQGQMSPNPAMIPPKPGGPPQNLPPAPMGAATGMFP